MKIAIKSALVILVLPFVLLYAWFFFSYAIMIGLPPVVIDTIKRKEYKTRLNSVQMFKTEMQYSYKHVADAVRGLRSWLLR